MRPVVLEVEHVLEDWVFEVVAAMEEVAAAMEEVADAMVAVEAPLEDTGLVEDEEASPHLNVHLDEIAAGPPKQMAEGAAVDLEVETIKTEGLTKLRN